MNRILLALLLCLPAFAQLKMGEASEGYMPLFNGRDLDGWEGNPALWKVEGGSIVGSTDGVPPIAGNTFLIYQRQKFQDFELRADIKLRNGNSGIQFRSDALDNWVVKGLQADAADGNWWGSIYDEKGTRGVIVNGWKGKAETVVKKDDFNELRLYCKGGTVRITVNGMVTAELTGETPRSGVIALQVHRGPPMRVEVKNLRIKKLD